MAKITIDGRTFEGNSLSIVNGTVMIDGMEQNDTLTGKVRLEITGTLNSLTTDASVNMNGEIKGDVSAGGSVNCADVGGSVKADGSVNCDDVGGSVTANGSVRCDDVNGVVTAGGSVRHG